MSAVAIVPLPRPTFRRELPHGRTRPPRRLDAGSLTWWSRLHGAERVRDGAIAELHELLRREASFQIRLRTRAMVAFPQSDLDDLAVQSADDALVTVLRKLEDYRGESQFWTWARRFVQLEAPVSIRRRVGSDRISNDPTDVLALAARDPSPEERVVMRELLSDISDFVAAKLTTRQRAVLVAVAINGISAATLAIELETTPGAIYKSLHDARKRLSTEISRVRDGSQRTPSASAGSPSASDSMT